MTESTTRRAVLGTVVTTGLAGLAGCVASSRDANAPISETIDPDEATELTVTNGSGTIEVVGEERETITLEGQKRAASEDALEEYAVDVDRSGDAIAIDADGEASNWLFSLGPDPVADLEVAVPETLHVASLRIGSGTIDVRDVRGPLEVSAGSGTINIDGVEGGLTTETGSGAQTLSAIEDSLEAASGSGSITAELGSVAADSAIETGAGSVSLTLPDAVDATLEIETGSGSATVEGSAVDRIDTSDDVDLTLGDGTHTITIETGSGDVSVTVGN